MAKPAQVTETKETAAETLKSAVTGLQFTRMKKLSQNQLKLVIGKPVYVKITGAIYVGKDIPGENKQAAHLADCIDLETGENCIIVVPMVVESTLTETYPEAGYVGKCFEVEKLEKDNPAKKYFPYAVTEIEVNG